MRANGVARAKSGPVTPASVSTRGRGRAGAQRTTAACAQEGSHAGAKVQAQTPARTRLHPSHTPSNSPVAARTIKARRRAAREPGEESILSAARSENRRLKKKRVLRAHEQMLLLSHSVFCSGVER